MPYSREQIVQWRKEGKTLQEISNLLFPKISSERVRQILIPDSQRKSCELHSVQFVDSCVYCLIQNQYVQALKIIFKRNIQNEIIRLFVNNRRRDKKIVIQRAIIVKKMKDELDLSFSKIGQLTGRHHTTIMNLYRYKL